MKRFSISILLISLLITSCSAPAPEEPSPEPQTDTITESPTEIAPTSVPAPETGDLEQEQTVETVPDETQSDPSSQILEGILPAVNDNERVEATFFGLLAKPTPSGDMLIYHYEDAIGDTPIGCTVYAVVRLADDGATFEPISGDIFCQNERPEYMLVKNSPAIGFDENGEQTAVIFGEIYSADVVAIRGFYEGGNAPAFISNGAYIITYPSGSLVESVVAYDGDGNEIAIEIFEPAG